MSVYDKWAATYNGEVMDEAQDTVLDEFWEAANFSAEVETLVIEKLVVVVAKELIDYVKGQGDKAMLVIMRKDQHDGNEYI
ncbi:hypothetical protein ACQKWADRAFT_311024 [Trichoderma austrokoningii]